MAEKKFVDGSGVKVIKKDYNDKIDKKVDKVEGSQLIETTKVTKLDGIADGAEVNKIDAVKINGVAIEIQSKEVDITPELLAPDLVDYAKTSEVQKTYATKEEMEALKAAAGSLGKIEGQTTTEGMATLKDTAQAGQAYQNTDDNHIYVFAGEGKQGADANGFLDFGEAIDLSDFANAKALEDLKTQVDGLDETYAKDSELTEAISGLESTYAKITELPEALSESEIQEILQAEE